MGILTINTNSTGQIDVNPRRVTIMTTDSLATVTTAGYLNPISLQGYNIYPTDVIEMLYAYNTSTKASTLGFFQPTITAGVITLDVWENAGGAVQLPVVDGDFAIFNGTTGQIKDGGYSPSDATKTKVAMAYGAVTLNHISVFADTAGTVTERTAATAINSGDLQAGLSGTAGALVSFPLTASKGSLKLSATANSGDTVTNITNAAMGQATTLTIPDPGGATAKVNLTPGTLVSGNLIKASGTAGLLADMGYRIIAGTTASFAGGSSSNAFTVTGLATACVGSAVIRTSTNAVAIAKAVPSTNTLTITFTADPGASTTVDYVYLTAAAT